MIFKSICDSRRNAANITVLTRLGGVGFSQAALQRCITHVYQEIIRYYKR